MVTTKNDEHRSAISLYLSLHSGDSHIIVMKYSNCIMTH